MILQKVLRVLGEQETHVIWRCEDISRRSFRDQSRSFFNFTSTKLPPSCWKSPFLLCRPRVVVHRSMSFQRGRVSNPPNIKWVLVGHPIIYRFGRNFRLIVTSLGSWTDYTTAARRNRTCFNQKDNTKASQRSVVQLGCTRATPMAYLISMLKGIWSTRKGMHLNPVSTK